jgi:hypothetical protein
MFITSLPGLHFGQFVFFKLGIFPRGIQISNLFLEILLRKCRSEFEVHGPLFLAPEMHAKHMRVAPEMHAWESLHVDLGMHAWHMQKCLHAALEMHA